MLTSSNCIDLYQFEVKVKGSRGNHVHHFVFCHGWSGVCRRALCSGQALGTAGSHSRYPATASGVRLAVFLGRFGSWWGGGGVEHQIESVS